MSSSFRFWFLFAVLAISAGNGLGLADDGDGRGHRHGGGGHNFFGISPGGITYGYSDQNFGFAIGPVGNGAFRNNWGGGYSDGYGSPYPVYSSPPVYYSQPGISYDSEPIYEGGYANPPAEYRGPAGTRSAPPSFGSNSSTSRTGKVPSPAAGSTSNHKSVLVRPGSDPAAIENLVTAETAREYYEQSRSAFAQGDYRNAARHALHSMLEDPENGKLKLYVSQCQLANGDFEAAAAHLLDGLNQLPEAQWGLVVQNFRLFYKQNDYVSQFEQLVKYSQQDDSPALASALRAYHYFYLGHPEAASKQLQKALNKDARDPLAEKLTEILDLPLPQKESGDSVDAPSAADSQ